MIHLKAPRSGLARLCALAAVASLAALSVSAPSQAAVPDVYGFVLWNGGAVVAGGTTPATTTVAAVTPNGRYAITFPGEAASGPGIGVVHITAINSSPHFCQVNSYAPSGPNEVVMVSCYRVSGAPDVSGFSAIFDSSSGTSSTAGQFGYVNSAVSGALISSYPTSGPPNTVIRTSTGVWMVQMPALTTPGPRDGDIQATPVNQQVPSRCKVTNWTSSPSVGVGQQIQINCYDQAGNPFDTQFTMTYQYLRSLYGPASPPKFFGYLWEAPPLGPVSTNYNSQAGPGTNAVSPGGTPVTTVKFPLLTEPPDDIQVTAFGTGPAFCDMTAPWFYSGGASIVQTVNCYNPVGAPFNSGFLISDSSRN